jgi:hypothetical protein
MSVRDKGGREENVSHCPGVRVVNEGFNMNGGL